MEACDTFSDGTSELSSISSRSPSPPSGFYISPPSSQQSSASSPQPETDDSQCTSAENEAHPAKRRKISERMPRETRHLDLRSLAEDPTDGQKAEVERLLQTLRKKRKIVVVAGAGISTSAGVPDFRSSNGIFNTLKSQYNLKASGKQLFDAAVYKDDKSTSTFHDMVRSLSQLTKEAQPTPFHHMLARLAQEGRLLRLYSQNVDGIDTALPPLATQVPLNRKGPWPRTIQLHGGLEKMTCTKCHNLSDFQPELFQGPVPPPCEECQERDHIRTELESKRSHGIGKLRPRMVLYNEHNPDDEAIGAVTRADLRTRPDAVIVVGTTLKVPGVKRIVREMCRVVKDRRDGLTVWINNDAEPILFENCWDLVVRGSCDEVAAHASLRKWDDPINGEFSEMNYHGVVALKERIGTVQVVVNSLATPINTPPASPWRGVSAATPSTVRKANYIAECRSFAQVLAKGYFSSVDSSTKTLQATASKMEPKAKKKSTVEKRVRANKKAPSAKSMMSKDNETIKFPVSKPISRNPGDKIKSKEPSTPKKQIRSSQDQHDISGQKVTPSRLHPMSPLSPSAARVNTTPVRPPLFPNLGKSFDDFSKTINDVITVSPKPSNS